MLLIDRSKSAAQCVRARVRTHPRLLCHGAGYVTWSTVLLYIRESKSFFFYLFFTVIFLQYEFAYTARADVRRCVEGKARSHGVENHLFPFPFPS